MKNNHAFNFTVTCNNSLHMPIIDIYISKKKHENEPIESFITKLSKEKSYKCCLDTGSNSTSIHQNVIKKLGLEKNGSQKTIVTPNCTSKVDCYSASLLLPNNFPIHIDEITEMTGGFDVLIGMDILRYCDLAITNKNNIMTVSLYCPSQHYVDFQNLE